MLMRPLTPVVVLAVALAVAGTAAASPPLRGTGTSVLTSATVTGTRQADGNTIVEQVNTRAVTGALTGTFTEHFRLVAHKTGLVTAYADAVAVATFAGCGSTPLTVPFTVAAQVFPSGEARGTFTTAGNAPIVATGKVEGTVASLTYEVTYHC